MKMHGLKILLGAVLLILSGYVMPVLAQDSYDFISFVQKPSSTGGEVTIHQSKAITEIYNKHLYELRSNKTIDGYRVRLASESGQNAKEKITQQRTKFIAKHPDIDTYVDYTAPYFRLYAGDYRVKSDAYKLWSDIKYDFPGSFPVRQTIRLPKIDKQNLPEISGDDRRD